MGWFWGMLLIWWGRIVVTRLLGMAGMGLVWRGGLAIGGECTVERLCGCAGKICRQEWRHGTPGGVRHVKVGHRLRC